MTAQEWHPVVTHPGIYEVSATGEVWSHLSGRLLTGAVGPGGGRQVWLSRPDRRVGVHVLVLEAFVGPKPFPEAEARHLDGDPTNNTPGNLAWGDRFDIAADKTRRGTHNNTKRATCRPRGHQLRDANLDPVARREGKRKCYACRWASLCVSNARVAGRPIPDADALAEAMYAFLMDVGPDPRPAPRRNTHATRVRPVA